MISLNLTIIQKRMTQLNNDTTFCKRFTCKYVRDKFITCKCTHPADYLNASSM